MHTELEALPGPCSAIRLEQTAAGARCSDAGIDGSLCSIKQALLTSRLCIASRVIKALLCWRSMCSVCRVAALMHIC